MSVWSENISSAATPLLIYHVIYALIRNKIMDYVCIICVSASTPVNEFRLSLVMVVHSENC